MVGATGFEPATSASQRQRSTRLSYAPIEEPLYQGRGPGPSEDWAVSCPRMQPDPAKQKFDAEVEWLDSLARRRWHDGLGRMMRLLELLDLQDYVWGPQKPKYLHVAGTNGKGSVTCMIKQILLSHGFKTGAAFSPYVDDFRERVQFGSESLPYEEFLNSFAVLAEADAQLTKSPFEGASAFELKTALGFLMWKKLGAEAVALEVGMGGRLDASNVVDPGACVIVSIGWDHKDVLGDTLAKIAAEKAGIIKQDRPLLLGRVPLEAEEVILARARALNAPVWQIDKELEISSHGGHFDLRMPGISLTGLKTKLFGEMQKHNAALAVGAVHQSGIALEPDKVREALMQATLPGRFEEIDWNGVSVFLDGAHNQPAAENLAANLLQKSPGKKRGLLLSMLQGHDADEFLAPLRGLFDCAVTVTGTSPRGRKGSDLLPALKKLGLDGEFHLDRATALLALRNEGVEVICATGSFYGLTLVREAVTGKTVRS